MKSPRSLRACAALVGILTVGAHAAVDAHYQSTAYTVEVSAPPKAVEPLASEKFVQRALATGEQEMQSAERAAACASHTQIKQVAEFLARDHALTYEQLSSLAQRKNWSVDTVSSMAAKTDARLATRVTQDNGAVSTANFDAQFVDEQIRGHQQSILLFREQAENGDDADIKAFARKTLPGLEARLEALRGLQP